ncbi:hypothetical protein V1264_020706 [Littorina saxatilis]
MLETFQSAVEMEHLSSVSLSDLGIRQGSDGQQMQENLQEQIMEGNLEALEHMAELGLEWKAEPTASKETPMHGALKQKDMVMFEKLLRIQKLIHVPNAYGETPLHLACRFGLDGAVSRLLEAGADMNAVDCEENTPVYHAVCGGQKECVKLLIKAGCDLDMLNNELMAPMDQALLYKDHDMVALLLRAGVETKKLKGHIYYRDHYSNSFFHGLWSDSTLHNMKLFLDCGYDAGKTEVQSLKTTCEMLKGPQTPVFNMLKEYTEEPKSLKWCCRQSARQFLMEMRSKHHTPMDTMISRLPLPSKIQRFLLLQENDKGGGGAL